jgi:hypothetical protein
MAVLLAALALLQGEPVSFGTVDKAATSGFQAPQQSFVATQKEWVDTWVTREGPVTPKKPHPQIDFSREVVIVAALGTKPTGGFAIEITRIVRTKDAIEIYVRKTAPQDGLKPPPGPTSPFVLARMPRPDRPVTFRDDDKK